MAGTPGFVPPMLWILEQNEATLQSWIGNFPWYYRQSIWLGDTFVPEFEGGIGERSLAGWALEVGFQCLLAGGGALRDVSGEVEDMPLHPLMGGQQLAGGAAG